MTDNVMDEDDLRRLRIAKDAVRLGQKTTAPLQDMLQDIAAIRTRLSALRNDDVDYDEANTLLQCAGERLESAQSIVERAMDFDQRMRSPEIAFERLHDLMQKGYAVSNIGTDQRDEIRVEHPKGSAVILYPNGFCDVFSSSFRDIDAGDHQRFGEFVSTVPRATWWMRAQRLGNDLTDGLSVLAILCVMTAVMIATPIIAAWSLLYYSARHFGLEAWVGRPFVLDWFGL